MCARNKAVSRRVCPRGSKVLSFADFAEVTKTDAASAALLRRIAWDRIPAHVAIIMDGNGRWAAARGQIRVAGHRAGIEAVRASVDTGARLGLRALTLYAFSTENWKRPRLEVDALMRMLKRYLQIEIDEIDRQNIRLQAIGRTDALPASVRRALDRSIEQTRGNTGMTLSLALNYGGRTEITDAARAAVRRLIAANRPPDDLTEDDIERELYTRDLPELDLLIRTSGEMRISNFLLWQAAYSEFYITETLFPDFRRAEFLRAVIEYQNRDRRFGGIAPVEPSTDDALLVANAD